MATIKEHLMYCCRCGLPMSYQEFEDEDGENFQWVCDGPNNNTEKKGCWNYVGLEGPLEFAEISNEQLVVDLIETSKRNILLGKLCWSYEHRKWYEDNEYQIDGYKAEILRRMKK